MSNAAIAFMTLTSKLMPAKPIRTEAIIGSHLDMHSLILALAAAATSTSPTPAPGATPAASPIDWPQWLTAIGTVGAVVIALVLAIWGDAIRAWRFRPKLDVSIQMKPPDCHRIQTTIQGLPGGMTGQVETYYCRMRIWNRGNLPARNVEVTLLKLHRQSDGRTAEDPDFLPLGLKWPHVPRTIMPVIPPGGFFRMIDLCHTYELGVDPASNWFEFDTEIRPNEIRPGVWPTRKGPGKYQLDLVASADNAKPVTRSLESATPAHGRRTRKRCSPSTWSSTS